MVSLCLHSEIGHYLPSDRVMVYTLSFRSIPIQTAPRTSPERGEATEPRCECGGSTEQVRPPRPRALARQAGRSVLTARREAVRQALTKLYNDRARGSIISEG